VLVTGTVEDDGIQLWTTQQGRQFPAKFSFSFLDSNVPAYVSTCGDQCPPSGTNTGGDALTIVFNNYCLLHNAADYQVTFSTDEMGAASTTVPIINVDYRASSCNTELTVETPAVSSGLISTVTVTPNGASDKAFTFEYRYKAELMVTTRCSTQSHCVFLSHCVALTALTILTTMECAIDGMCLPIR
jgi:hypothetical protein